MVFDFYLQSRKQELQCDDMDSKMLLHFKDPAYLIENCDGLLFSILKYRYKNDIYDLLNAIQPIEIKSLNDLKCMVIYQPHLIELKNDLFLEALSMYCQSLPKKKNTQLLDKMGLLINNNVDYQEIYEIVCGNESLMRSYCTNWLEFTIGLVLHRGYLQEQLYHILDNIPDFIPTHTTIKRIGISTMQVLKRIFLFQNVEQIIHLLSPSDAFLCKYIFNYLIQFHNFPGTSIHDIDIDWRCVDYLLLYKEYKTALLIANGFGKQLALSKILFKIPYTEYNFKLVEKFLIATPELLGNWYMVHLYSFRDLLCIIINN